MPETPLLEGDLCPEQSERSVLALLFHNLAEYRVDFFRTRRGLAALPISFSTGALRPY